MGYTVYLCTIPATFSNSEHACAGKDVLCLQQPQLQACIIRRQIYDELRDVMQEKPAGSLLHGICGNVIFVQAPIYKKAVAWMISSYGFMLQPMFGAVLLSILLLVYLVPKPVLQQSTAIVLSENTNSPSATRTTSAISDANNAGQHSFDDTSSSMAVQAHSQVELWLGILNSSRAFESVNPSELLGYAIKMVSVEQNERMINIKERKYK